MIRGFIGVPRVGKNTLLTMFAQRGLRERTGFLGLFGAKKYEHVYTDFACKGCEMINFQDLEKYKFYNSLIIFGEMGLEADNRDFKKFKREIRDFFVLHGHLWNDIYYATQNYENVDKKIRDLTEDLWCLSKSVVPIFREFTVARRIYRIFDVNEQTKDLVFGYRFCNFLEKLFAKNNIIVLRRRWYKYFDSWEEGQLAERPVFQSEEWALENNRQRKTLLQKLNAMKNVAASSSVIHSMIIFASKIQSEKDTRKF